MKIESNNATLIANEEMRLALITIKDKHIFMSHDELINIRQILNSEHSEEIRDMVNDYKELIIKDHLKGLEECDCDCCLKQELLNS